MTSFKLFLVIIFSTIFLEPLMAFVWMEGTWIYSSYTVEYAGQNEEIYRARNTALAYAQAELLKFIWSLKLNENITLLKWSDQRGYTEIVEGVLKNAEIFEERFQKDRVTVIIRKKLDIEQIYKLVGKNHVPVLSKQFTGIVLVVGRPKQFFLAPTIVDENGKKIYEPKDPMIYFDSLLEAFESSIVGYVPLVIRARTNETGEIVVNERDILRLLEPDRYRELLEQGRLAVVIESD